MFSGQAILWAGRTCQVDIISMSFGFPRDNRQIGEAITTVQRERGDSIIFLASAGGFSTDEESFPARHPEVLSVHATNSEGIFPSPPTTVDTGATMLGTFGHDIPDRIQQEFRPKYEHVCQPGSSVATAVLAGISATMLAYSHALPSLLPFGQESENAKSRRILRHMHSTKGMEAALLAMSKAGAYASRHRAVNPMIFWRTHAGDMERSTALITALAAVDRKAEKLTAMS